VGSASGRRKFKPSSDAAMPSAHRKQLTSQAWLSISRRSYQRRKPSLPMERAGSVTQTTLALSSPAVNRIFR
jgi:hypothetical protein